MLPQGSFTSVENVNCYGAVIHRRTNYIDLKKNNAFNIKSYQGNLPLGPLLIAGAGVSFAVELESATTLSLSTSSAS